MLPTLWPGDVVEIDACSVDEVQPGEIVLALREGRFFFHRFLARSQPNAFLLRGDSMPGPDPPYPNEALLGRLVSCESQSRSHDHIPDRAAAHPVFPLRPWSWAIGQLLSRCGPARRLTLKVHARRRRDAAEIQANLGTLDPGAS